MYIDLFKTTVKKNPIEIILLICSLIITLICGFVYLKTVNAEEAIAFVPTESPTELKPASSNDTQVIFVEISGAVTEPNVYKLPSDARLYNLIQEAGGLTPTADADFVARNFNLAKRMADQEKFYIPYQTDITQGIFVEQPQRLLEYLSPFYSEAPSSTTSQAGTQTSGQGIAINTATSAELDTLPGIGPSTAQKIIDNRPYNSVDELLSKNVVKDSVFEQIQSLISL